MVFANRGILITANRWRFPGLMAARVAYPKRRQLTAPNREEHQLNPSRIALKAATWASPSINPTVILLTYGDNPDYIWEIYSYISTLSGAIRVYTA